MSKPTTAQNILDHKALAAALEHACVLAGFAGESTTSETLRLQFERYTERADHMISVAPPEVLAEYNAEYNAMQAKPEWTRDDYEAIEALAGAAMVGLLSHQSAFDLTPPKDLAQEALAYAEALVLETKARLGEKPQFSL